MTNRGSTAGIVDAIRNGTIQAFSNTLNFVAALPIFDAAMLGAFVGALIGWRQHG